MTAIASAFDTVPASVLANFFIGVDPESALGQPPVYRPYVFDLTGLVLPGVTYQLRFGEVDNQFVLNQGVDNVSVNATVAPTGAVPEPGTWALMVATGVALAALRWRVLPRRGRRVCFPQID